MEDHERSIDPVDLERALADVHLEQARRELCRVSYPHFCEAVFGWPAHGVELHDKWNDHIESCWRERRYAGIQGPRSHGKTMQVAVGRSVLEMGQSTLEYLWDDDRYPWVRPGVRIKLFQNKDGKAKESTSLIKTIIERSPAVHQIFPAMQPDPNQEWSGHRLFIKRPEFIWHRDPSFEGAAVLSTTTSGRADIIKADDICDLTNSLLEPATRPKILQAWDGTIYQLREPHTCFVDIGTAWHELDANASLQKRKRWKWQIYRIQATRGAPMVPLWPDKWNIEALMESYENSPREFDRGFNNWPYQDKESIVDREHLHRCFRPDLAPFERAFTIRYTGVGYDLAIGESEDASYFAAFVLGVSGDGVHRQPLHIIRKQAVPFRQQSATALGLHKRIDPTPSIHVVENVAYQEALVQQIRADGNSIPVEGFTTGKQKMDPYVGLPMFDPSFAAGEWVIGTKGGHDGETIPECECPQCVWLRELMFFPAATSDILMASWLIHQRMRSSIGMAQRPDDQVNAAEFAQEFGEQGTFLGDDESFSD